MKNKKKDKRFEDLESVYSELTSKDPTGYGRSGFLVGGGSQPSDEDEYQSEEVEEDSDFDYFEEAVEEDEDSYLSDDQIFDEGEDVILPVLNDEKINALNTILNSKHTLITARAGSGKTRLLLALIQKLIKDGVNKNHILSICFNKSVSQKNTKDLADDWNIKNYFGFHTFHALSFEILRANRGVTRSDVIEDQGNRTRVIQILKDIVKDEGRKNLLFRMKFWWYLRELEKEVTNQDSSFVSLRGEDLKSFGEKVIADFLFENGFEYEYEPRDWGDYRPDFKVGRGNQVAIIEYWGSDNLQYKRQKEWKREYWNKRDVSLIEMDFRALGSEGQGRFEALLEKELLDRCGLEKQALSDEEKATQVFDRRITKLVTAIDKFINFSRVAMRSSDYSLSPSKKDTFFAEISFAVQEKYLAYLYEHNLYDFPRMLERATEIVRELGGETKIRLGVPGAPKEEQITLADVEWFLIDEFQDFSPIFNQLTSEIQIANPNIRFVCVGDDWQAINGFAGSDTVYMKKEVFNRKFPEAAHVNLCENFRSANIIVETGNDIMANLGMPAKSTVKEEGQVWRILMPNFKTQKERYDNLPALYFQQIERIAGEYPVGTSFTILRRTNNFFAIKPEEFVREVTKRMKEKNQENVRVSTIHKFKGDQADVVILVDVTEKMHPLIHPERTRHFVLGLNDEKVHREERNLFYVGLTRAKKALWIISEEGRESPYVKEIRWQEPEQ